MLRTQPNFLVHVTLAVAALVLGVVLRLGPTEFAVIVLTVALVMVTECVNTALEALSDLVSPGYHPLIKRAKDVSAAAVLIGAIGALVVAALLFVPRLASMIR